MITRQSTQTASPPRSARRGISITEMLIALAISAMLLTAVTVALNASFYAYATAAESASTHSSVRLVMQRVMRMLRTTTHHAPYDPDDASIDLIAAETVYSVGIHFEDHSGQIVYIWWKANSAYDEPMLGDLWYADDNVDAEPLLERVIARGDVDDPYIFSLSSRKGPDGLLLRRATLDLAVQPGADATLALESAQGKSPPVRIVASTMPRRNLD